MATWWSQREGPPNADAVARRIVSDPHYRIWLAVTNNPDAAIHRYMASYAVSVRPGASHVITQLQQLWDHGYTQAVESILDIPWIASTDPMLDRAYTLVQDDYRDMTGAPLEGEGPEKWVQFVVMGVVAIGGVVQQGMKNKAQRKAQEAAQARVDMLAEIQRRADAEKAARQKRTQKAIGIGALAIVAIIVSVIIYRRST